MQPRRCSVYRVRYHANELDESQEEEKTRPLFDREFCLPPTGKVMAQFLLFLFKYTTGHRSAEKTADLFGYLDVY